MCVHHAENIRLCDGIKGVSHAALGFRGTEWASRRASCDDEWVTAPEGANDNTRLAQSQFANGSTAMSITEIVYLPEDPAHGPAIEEINAEAFGPGRYTRAAYRIREGGPHDMELSFVAATPAGEVVGSVRMTHVSAGAGTALLLGPLAVRPAHKNVGIGRKLVQLAIEAAKAAGQSAVLLVGDAPYYGPLGFARLPNGQILMPGPVDPHRMLGLEIAEGALGRLKGPLVHRNLADRVHAQLSSAGSC